MYFYMTCLYAYTIRIYITLLTAIPLLRGRNKGRKLEIIGRFSDLPTRKYQEIPAHKKTVQNFLN